MSEIRRTSMPMMQHALMDRIAIDPPFGLIPTLSSSDNIIQSRRTRGNARIPTAGDQVRKVLHAKIIPSLLAAMLMRWRRSNAVGRISAILVALGTRGSIAGRSAAIASLSLTLVDQ